MADSLLNPAGKDMTPVCYVNASGRKTSAPMYVAKEMLRKYGGEILDYEQGDWTPKKKLRPYDEEKKAHAQKSANTEKTGLQIAEYNKMTHDELDAFAEEKGVDLKGTKNKKSKLKALEDAGVLY